MLPVTIQVVKIGTLLAEPGANERALGCRAKSWEACYIDPNVFMYSSIYDPEKMMR